MATKSNTTSASEILPSNVVQLPRAPRMEDLPFVIGRAKAGLPEGKFPRCFWHVQPTGDYENDCRTGYKFAVEYLKVQSAEDAVPMLLLWIVGDMPRELSGIEVGFLTIVAHSAGGGAPYGFKLVEYWKQCREKGKV